MIAIDAALRAQVLALGEALRARRWRLATAESCTGGLLAGTCTAPAGASDWFDAGFVSYANEAKTGLLGVPAALVEAHGAVSEEVAHAMARGALAGAGVDLALSITGVAGPGGGSVAKPVGTVWMGWAWRSSSSAAAGGPGEQVGSEQGGSRVRSRAERHHFQGDRDAVRACAVEAALRRLLALAREAP